MEKFKYFIKSFFSLFAIMRITGMSTKSPLSIILFLMFVYLYSNFKSDKFESRRTTCDISCSAILSVLFTIFTISASYNVIMGGLTSTLFCLVILAATAVGFVILYFHLCLWLLLTCSALPLADNVYSPSHLPLIASLACLICWLPYFLFEYPGVMTPDSINQFSQVVGIYELNNQHSVVHTAFLGLCYNAGLQLFGSTYAGLAFYTVVQMIFMAFTAGYVVRTLQKANAITPVIIITICFYAFMPYNGAYAVTIWKDIFFAGFMTLWAASLMRLLINDSGKKLTACDYLTIILPYTISAIMVGVLRSNGFYCLIVTIPFVIYIYRKNLKLIIPVNALILLLVLFVKYPLMDIYEIKQPDFAESISIPLQQIACVISNGESLTDKEYEYVNKIMDTSEVPYVYEPDVSDNIKNLVRKGGLTYLEEDKEQFFKTWLSIGLKHPKAYFDAYVDQTVGYWFPDVDSEVGLADGIYDNSLGLSWQPVISGQFLVKLKEIVFKLPELVPLFGLLWSMGFMFWLILLTSALCFRSGKAKNATITLPFVVLVLTLCIAAPVSNEFRYAYPLFYALPILLLTPFIHNGN